MKLINEIDISSCSRYQ